MSKLTDPVTVALAEARTRAARYTTPNGYETAARVAREKNDFALAAVYWSLAQGVTLGHNRSERYREAEAADIIKLRETVEMAAAALDAGAKIAPELAAQLSAINRKVRDAIGPKREHRKSAPTD